jgi:hypothetical protein
MRKCGVISSSVFTGAQVLKEPGRLFREINSLQIPTLAMPPLEIDSCSNFH